jgi:hypothetical protein
LRLHPDVHPTDGVLHGGAEVTRPEVELITDATLGAAIVDDLFGIRPVAPTSRCPNADVGILDGQQWNVRTMCGSRTGGWSLPCVMSD